MAQSLHHISRLFVLVGSAFSVGDHKKTPAFNSEGGQYAACLRSKELIHNIMMPSLTTQTEETKVSERPTAIKSNRFPVEVV